MDREAAAAALGLNTAAGEAEVRRAARAVRARWHPDRHGGDPAAAARFREAGEALEVLLSAPTPAELLRLRVSGERAWRGGAVEVEVGGRRLRVRLPQGVAAGDVLPGELDLRPCEVLIGEVDYWPWRREGRDLRAELRVAAHDVVVGAEVDVPTPWGEVRLRLARGRLRTLRLRGRGVRREGEPDGDLLLDLAVDLPPPDPIVAAALRPHARPPRVV